MFTQKDDKFGKSIQLLFLSYICINKYLLSFFIILV
jgi:hypothetical protein